jgi:hypothetical protein
MSNKGVHAITGPLTMDQRIPEITPKELEHIGREW